jgi:4'-phosphopantetheinyl transferase
LPLIEIYDLEPQGVVGLWRNDEGDNFYVDRLMLHAAEVVELDQLQPRKRSEWLSSRYLLHHLSGRHDRGACLKDDYGKPYLEGSDYHISISHSDQYTAVIAGPRLVGIDVQIVVDKIQRIASKFVNATEAAWITSDHYLMSLHAVWGAKEAMYKAYGRKELDFRGHMEVEPWYPDQKKPWYGHVHKDQIYQKYRLQLHHIHNLVIVYAIQID